MLGNRQRRQRVVIGTALAFAIALSALFVRIGAFDANLQTVTYDFFITSAPAAVKNQVTIVAIDDATITRYKVYPIPRRAYVDLLRSFDRLDLDPAGKLALQKPRMVAFDIGMYDPSSSAADDAALADAIKQAGNVILAAQGQGAGIRDEQAGTVTFPRMQLPIPEFTQAAAGIGIVNIYPDDDAKVRRVQLYSDTPQGRLYALPLVAASRSLLQAGVTTTDERGIRRDGDRLVLPGRGDAGRPDRIMPIDASGQMAIYYSARPTTDLVDQKGRPPCSLADEFCIVSLVDVLDGKIPRQLLFQRTVFVGYASASAVPDSYPTPNSASDKTFGVEIWSAVAQSLYTNRYPVFHQGAAVTLGTFIVLLVVGVFLVLRFRIFGFLAGLGVSLAYFGVSLLLFKASVGEAIGHGPIEVPSIAYVVVPSVFWWVMLLGYLLIEEQLAVTRTQSTFGRFVTPSVARTILDMEETGLLRLGGEEKRVTVLFGDIRGFTTMSEGMSPATLLNTLNQYFEGIVDVVNRYEGTVNKYNGDNIMVIWGAPLDVQDQARKAVECALEIQRWIVGERAKGGPDVSFGFGINTGTVVAGFLGAKGRMEYTVIGDTANVASRLTSSDIARRDQVAVSAATLSELGEDVASVDLGAVQVKGRTEAVSCFQVDRLGTVANPNPAPAPERPIAAAAVAGYH